MLYRTISWCYGSKKILWIQSFLGLLGLLGGVGGWGGVGPGFLNKVVDFGEPKLRLDS